MNGDEVRGVWFLGARGPGHYNKADVNDLLARVAAELDSGRPAGPLIANATFRAPSTFVSKIGCLTGAVDWFLEQLRLQDESSEMARMNTDPWRDLATEPYCVYREPGELAGLIAAPPQQEYVDFYTRVLHFRLTTDQRSEPNAYVSLQRDDVRIGAARRIVPGVRAARLPPAGVELVLEVDYVLLSATGLSRWDGRSQRSFRTVHGA